jgi:hypothetical protein
LKRGFFSDVLGDIEAPVKDVVDDVDNAKNNE